MNKRRNSRRRKVLFRRKAVLLVVFVCCFVLFSSINAFANSSNEPVQVKTTTKTFVSYEIKSGDNMYTVAKENCDLSHYRSYEEYILEIEKINHINSNNIVAGRSITIPKYV